MAAKPLPRQNCTQGRAVEKQTLGLLHPLNCKARYKMQGRALCWMESRWLGWVVAPQIPNLVNSCYEGYY